MALAADFGVEAAMGGEPAEVLGLFAAFFLVALMALGVAVEEDAVGAGDNGGGPLGEGLGDKVDLLFSFSVPAEGLFMVVEELLLGPLL